MSTANEARPPWLALAASPTAWFAYEQGLGTVVRLDCAPSGWIGLATGLLALVVCILAGGLGFRAAGGAGIEGGGRAPQFIGLVAAAEGVVMSLAIVFQLLAALIVPPCAR